MTIEIPLFSIKVFQRDRLTPQCEPSGAPRFIVEVHFQDRYGVSSLLKYSADRATYQQAAIAGLTFIMCNGDAVEAHRREPDVPVSVLPCETEKEGIYID